MPKRDLVVQRGLLLAVILGLFESPSEAYNWRSQVGFTAPLLRLLTIVKQRGWRTHEEDCHATREIKAILGRPSLVLTLRWCGFMIII